MKVRHIDQEEDGRGELVIEVELGLGEMSRPAMAVLLCLTAILQQLVNEGRMSREDMEEIMEETVVRSDAALEAGYVDIVVKLKGGEDDRESL